MARILIIDGNEKVRGLLAQYLGTRSHEVAGVENGLAAARQLREQPADLLLIDQDVPMGGFKTARILRLHPAHQQIPVVLTVHRRETIPELAAQGKRLNLNTFLAKPCTGKTLEAKIEESLRQRLGKISVADMRQELAQLSELPVLPASHRKMLNLLAREDAEVDIPELTRTIETDQGLTTEILRVCNSAYYGFRGNTITSATTFLGIDKIRKIVQASILFDLFQDGSDQEEDGFSIMALWKHSVACGLIMEEGGHRVKGRDHFIAGMLHDVGKVILYLRFREHFEEIRRMAHQEEMPMLQAEQTLMGITHADIGHELARKWDLPSTIAAAIAFHHRPSAALQHRRLAALVHLSDVLARKLEIGHGGDVRQIHIDPMAHPLAKYVFAAAKNKEAIVAEVESVVNAGADPTGTAEQKNPTGTAKRENPGDAS